MIGSVVIDWEYVRSLRELQAPDEPDIVAELVKVFSSESVTRVGLLHDAVRRHDAEQIRRLAHVLRGSAGQIGAIKLARISRELETSMSAGGDASTLVAAVDDALREALATLEAGDAQLRFANPFD